MCKLLETCGVSYTIRMEELKKLRWFSWHKKKKKFHYLNNLEHGINIMLELLVKNEHEPNLAK